jgi:hypothetical protein
MGQNVKVQIGLMLERFEAVRADVGLERQCYGICGTGDAK